MIKDLLCISVLTELSPWLFLELFSYYFYTLLYHFCSFYTHRFILDKSFEGFCIDFQLISYLVNYLAVLPGFILSSSILRPVLY